MIWYLDIHKSGVCRDSFRIFVIKGVAEVLITKLGKRVMTNIAIQYFHEVVWILTTSGFYIAVIYCIAPNFGGSKLS